MPEALKLDKQAVPVAGMAALVAAKDWSLTPLGPAEKWPQSLRTAAGLCIESGFPMLVCWGPQLVMIYNDGYIPVLGVKHPAALGQPLLECWSEIREMLVPMFGSVVETGRAIYANDLMFPLGRRGFTEECYFTFSYSPIRDETGGVGGVLVTCTETTRRVIGERRLRTLRDLAARASEAKTDAEAWSGAQRALAQNPFGIPFAILYAIDETGDAARRVASCGLAEDSPAAPSSIDLRTPAAGWPMQTAASGKTELVRDVAHRFGALRGTVWPEPVENALVIPILRPGLGRPYGMLIVGLSPRLELDEDYRSFLGLVAEHIATAVANARAYEEERKRSSALAELDRAKTTFFSNVSHEFRTPLTLMLAPLDDLVRDSALPPPEREELLVVRRNGQRLLKLVNTLLDFSRIEAGRVQASYEPTDLSTVTADLASVFRSAVERAGLAFEIDCGDLEVPVYVDRDMWEKIVFNLLSNALKFTLEGRIAVRLRTSEAGVELEVADTGAGIPAQGLPRLFERFHRVEGTRGRTQEGTGIGLALVQELVKLHGGSVRVRSSPGQGSVFTVTLPLGAAHLPRDRIQAPRTLASTAVGAGPFVEEALRWTQPDAELPDGSAALPLTPAPPAALRRARLLIADDNGDMRDYLQRLLGRRWQVESFPDGARALTAARARPPDLILSDVMMPELDGFGLIKELRADPATAEIPVMLISARAGDEAQADARGAGADDYVVKPFTAKELVARVESQLALAALRRSRELQRDDLRRLFMGAPAVLALLRGPEHVFELANEAYQQLVGHRDLIGRKVRDVFPEVEGQGYFELLDRVLRTGEPYLGKESRLLLHRAQGAEPEECFINFTYQPFRESDGSIGGIVAFGFEVTELVRARQRTEALAEQARLADRRKDEFLAIVSHELRNPLAPIATAVKLMELRGEESSRREREVIERQVTHLSRLVNDLLDVSRIAQGKIQLYKQVVDIAEVAAKAVEMVAPLLERRSHLLDVAVPGGESYVEGDPVRLAQVLENLLTNAARYTQPRGNIRLSAAREGEEVIVRVKDDGMGITPDFLPRIFDLFVQGPRAIDRRDGGLGLGLTLVKNLVALHGGTVSARSQGPGLGSEFEVRLPASPTKPDLSPRSRPKPRPRQSRRVLVVDDNVDAADTLAAMLLSMGHEVAVAHDGAEALQVQARFDAEVGILDLGLPVMDGYELAAEMRRATTKPLRLIALTGYGQDRDRERTSQAGFDAHAVKPVEIEDLNELIAGEGRSRV